MKNKSKAESHSKGNITVIIIKAKKVHCFHLTPTDTQ